MDSTLSQPQIDPVEEALSRIAQIARDKDRQASASDSELFPGRIIVPAVGHKIRASEPTGDLSPKESGTGGRRAAHGFGRFFIAACIGVAATLAGQTYGGTALRATATWVPQLSWLASLPPTSSAGTEPAIEEPASAIEASATDPTNGQAEPAVEPPGDMMPAARPAAPSPELLQQLEAMGRDIAAVRQMVEQLTASPEHKARDISNLQESGRRTLGPPRPATKTRKPLSVLPEPQSGPESSSAPLPITAASPPAH